MVQLKKEEILAKIQDLTKLSDQELNQLHYDLEIYYATSIKNSKKASTERDQLFFEAYDLVYLVLGEMRMRAGREMWSRPEVGGD